MCSCNTVVELADYTKEMAMIVKATDVLSGYERRRYELLICEREGIPI